MNRDDDEIATSWLLLISGLWGLALVLPSATSSPAWWEVVSIVVFGAMILIAAARIVMSAAITARQRRTALR